MPKKIDEKKPKKVAKAPTPKEVKTTKAAKSPSSIDALPDTAPSTPPSPSSTAPAVNIVLNQPAPNDTQTSSATPVPAKEPVTPSEPTEIPAIITEPDVTTGVINDSLTMPQADTPLISTASPVSDDTDDFEPEQGGGGLRILLIFITALLVGGIAVGGFLYYSQMQASEGQTPIMAEPTVPVAAEPTEDPEATGSAQAAELAELSVQILNGSGTAGEAARVRDALETGGFAKFSLGNADSYDYTDTEVQMREGLPESVFEAVETALEDYTVVEESTLSATATHDIVIFVGQRK